MRQVTVELGRDYPPSSLPIYLESYHLSTRPNLELVQNISAVHVIGSVVQTTIFLPVTRGCGDPFFLW